ncbi:uncharacterized protein LOC134209479 [Armigeres subalbatus]|uniref:uncharacterized protein LOC134209479 n=1 Tax=Armigeres subalbatus TaxID=124917 RepID=UPI002ED166F2
MIVVESSAGNMKMLTQITITLALIVACTYASSTNSTHHVAAQHPPSKHRTARLVREFPSSVEPRMQSIEYPSYNIPNPYGPGTYAFGYEIEDPQTGNVQFRDEEKLQNGTVRGSYGYMQPDGSVIITRFLADFLGYRATTEIRRADGQTVASFPGRSPMPYNPAINPDFIDPQYNAAILSHIKNQQFNPSQGLVQYPNGIAPNFPMQDISVGPPGPVSYDSSTNGNNGNFFSNFFNQFPSNLSPANIYNNLQSTFPNLIPQQNPLNTFATNVQNGFQQFTQNNPFGNFVSNAQSQFQQNNPFAGWFNRNRFGQQQQAQQLQDTSQLFLQQQQQQQSLPLGYTGLNGLGASNYLSGHRVPTTKRRRIIGTTKRRKHGLKTRDDDTDWLEEFLESRKREMIYGLTTTTPESVLKEANVSSNKVAV